MKFAKIAQIVSNAIYSVGVGITLYFCIVCLFGSNEAISPDAMIPISWKEQAFIGLAVGMVPMLLACMAVYKFNAVKNTLHKRRNFFLVFFPGFICSACALFVAGLMVAGMINAIIRSAPAFMKK